MAEASSLRGTFMADPSLLLSRPGLEWLRTQPNVEDVVVSDTFMRLLNLRQFPLPRAFEGIHDRGMSIAQLEELLSLLDKAPRFSYSQSDLTALPDQQVLTALFARGSLREVYADEWTYLQTNSTMLSRSRKVIDVFTRAGAAVTSYGRRLRDEFIQMAIPSAIIPPQLTPGFLTLVGGKWLVIGGAAATTGIITGPAGALAGLLAAPVVRAFDG